MAYYGKVRTHWYPYMDLGRDNSRALAMLAMLAICCSPVPLPETGDLGGQHDVRFFIRAMTNNPIEIHKYNKIITRCLFFHHSNP